MKISELLPFTYTIAFFSLLIFSLFLNYISAVYSDVNLFKIDLTKRKGDKKLTFVLKNGNLLFVLICVYQVIINIFMSDMFMTNIGDPFLKEFEKINYR